ncbi:MAG: hypothetical protein CM1200mP3_10290 [Chloroflexota bacterium]|nr:MAG: hypothetical protein CM1200mP3_10290 [Chloroflexota bacterium]
MSEETSTEAVHTGHPTAGMYFKIAIILCVITAVEVGIFYLEDLGHWMIPILTILSLGKFCPCCHVLYAPEIRQQAFHIFFIVGLVLAAAVVSMLLFLFSAW